MSAVGGVVSLRARASLALAVLGALVFAGTAPAEALAKPTFSVMVPIIALQGDTDLLTADEISAGTAPGGAWAELAWGARSTGATIAVDSRIIASISALGDDAPDSATSWLDLVEQTDPLVLPWGNADPFLLGSIGPAFRVSTIQLSEISGIPAADFTAWPSGLAGSGRSVEISERLGFSGIIADDTTFPDASGAYSSDLSAIVADAVAPGATSDLGDVARQVRTLAHGTVRIAFPRNPSGIDVGRAVELLERLLSNDSRTQRFSPVDLTAAGKPVFRITDGDAIRTLMLQHRMDRRVSAMALDPSVVSTPRLRRLCVVAGHIDRPDFPAAVRSHVRAARDYSEFVTFSIGSDFTVLANSTELPLTITNNTEADITVVASVNATTGIVRITQTDYTVTVPAQSDVQVVVPMSSVANGTTSLRATLATTSGLSVGEPVYVDIDVQAQWEGVTLVSFIGIVSLILGIGIARTIRDRRVRR